MEIDPFYFMGVLLSRGSLRMDKGKEAELGGVDVTDEVA
jgi:hypothetical protein